MKRVTFAATYPAAEAHPLHRKIMAGTDVSRMELLGWGPTERVTTLSWLDADRRAVADLLAGLDTVETHLVDGSPGTYAFVAQESFELPAGVVDSVRRANVAFRPPVTFYDTGTVGFEGVGEASELAAFREDLAEVVDVRIERVQPFRRHPTPSGLTDRQAEALAAAVETGYYDVPRSGAVADVAERLDCTTSTAGELLRKAEAAVVSAFVDSQ